jgi:hypothetical protein
MLPRQKALISYAERKGLCQGGLSVPALSLEAPTVRSEAHNAALAIEAARAKSIDDQDA